MDFEFYLAGLEWSIKSKVKIRRPVLHKNYLELNYRYVVGCWSASVVNSQLQHNRFVKMPSKQFYSEEKLCYGMNLGTN